MAAMPGMNVEYELWILAQELHVALVQLAGSVEAARTDPRCGDAFIRGDHVLNQIARINPQLAAVRPASPPRI